MTDKREAKIELPVRMHYKGVKIEIAKEFVKIVHSIGGQSTLFEERVYLNGQNYTDEINLRYPVTNMIEQAKAFIDGNSAKFGIEPE